MKLSHFLFVPAVAACLVPAYAQDDIVIDPSQVTIINPYSALKALPKGPAPSFINAPKLAIWQYQFVSGRDGGTYTGSIVGGNPFNRGARTTTIPVVIVPVRVQFTGTVRNFDPTSPDVGCLGPGNTALSLLQASPVFQPVATTINGVGMGTVTFPDAFQRAAFWPVVSGFSPAYHLGFNVSVAATQTITVANNSSDGATTTFSGTNCTTNTTAQDNPPRTGLLNINTVDPLLNNMITNLGIAPNQFPLFLVYGVVMTDGSPIGGGSCCILGYHSTVTNTPTTANPGQTYGIAEYDQSWIFNGTKDISVITHEVLEWIDDPSGVNATPKWGGIGQVSACQDNLEVGDPLSGTLMPGVTMPNGVTYHAQELAFPQWFLGAPFAGAGGVYSSNGKFGGFAKACPPGGTF